MFLVGARREHVAAVAVAGRRRREVLDGRHAVLDAADVDAEVGGMDAAQLGRAGLRDVKVRRRVLTFAMCAYTSLRVVASPGRASASGT